MKLKTITKICIVYCIVPWLQKVLWLVVRAAGRLSRALDLWAWTAARGLNGHPGPGAWNGQADEKRGKVT